MSAALGGPQALWFVSRASGLAVLTGFSVAVVAGVAARSAPEAGSGSRPANSTGR